jgi:hypothetical protein
VLGLADKVEPRYAWSQVEAAILALPLTAFVAALRVGMSEESGCRIARAQMLDMVRRQLDEQAKGTQ